MSEVVIFKLSRRLDPQETQGTPLRVPASTFHALRAERHTSSSPFYGGACLGGGSLYGRRWPDRVQLGNRCLAVAAYRRAPA